MNHFWSLVKLKVKHINILFLYETYAGLKTKTIIQVTKSVSKLVLINIKQCYLVLSNIHL